MHQETEVTKPFARRPCWATPHVLQLWWLYVHLSDTLVRVHTSLSSSETFRAWKDHVIFHVISTSETLFRDYTWSLYGYMVKETALVGVPLRVGKNVMDDLMITWVHLFMSPLWRPWRRPGTGELSPFNLAKKNYSSLPWPCVTVYPNLEYLYVCVCVKNCVDIIRQCIYIHIYLLNMHTVYKNQRGSQLSSPC